MQLSKPISFKTAAVVVIMLHVVGFVGITQWSAYKTKLAREERLVDNQKKLEQLNKGESLWPKLTVKPKVVALPPPVSNKAEENKSFSIWDKLVANLPKFSTNKEKKNNNQNIKLNEIESAVNIKLQQLKEKASEIAEKEKNLLIKEQHLKQQTAYAEKQKNVNLPSNKNISKQNVSSNDKQQSKTATVLTSSSLSAQSQSNSYRNPPIVLSPETVKTYLKNGIEYIETEQILSSHIVLR